MYGTPPNLEYQEVQRERVNNFRKVPLYLGGFTLVFLSAYCTYLYIGYSRSAHTHEDCNGTTTDFDPSTCYDALAGSFDSTLETTEWLMGLVGLREKLASSATGDVLEVSIGTGRNLEYYDWNIRGHKRVGMLDLNGKVKQGKVRSFTAVDKSGPMLEVAHDKYSALFPGVIGVRWIQQDASDPIPGPPKNSNEAGSNRATGYDTVIQTMGLCSAQDPVKLLKNLGECVKDDGKILLIEHGRGTWTWINSLLDRTAVGRAKTFGCWWNRDLEKIIRDSGLEIVALKRKHFGTTWLIELRKPTAPAASVLSSQPSRKTCGKAWWH